MPTSARDYPELTPPETIPEDLLRQSLESCGQSVTVYRGCRIDHPERLTLGDHSQIDERVALFTGQGVTIGRHVHLAFDASISGGGRCEIGDFTGIGAGARILTGTEDPRSGKLTNPTIPNPEWRGVIRGDVTIGRHVLIFTNSLVFPNVTIGDGAVVSAGGIVHQDLKPWTLYAGNPLVAVAHRDPTPILELEKDLHP